MEQNIHLPGNWKKRVKTRTGGITCGRSDLYVISPLGKKLRSLNELCFHIEENNLFDTVDPTVVNFEKPQDSPEAGRKTYRMEKFAKFIHTRGSYRPDFIVKSCSKVVLDEVKLKIDTKCPAAFLKCSSCQLVLKDVVNGCCGLCSGRVGPVQIFHEFFREYKVFPIAHNLDYLARRTRWSPEQILRWFIENKTDDFYALSAATGRRLENYECNSQNSADFRQNFQVGAVNSVSESNESRNGSPESVATAVRGQKYLDGLTGVIKYDLNVQVAMDKSGKSCPNALLCSQNSVKSRPNCQAGALNAAIASNESHSVTPELQIIGEKGPKYPNGQIVKSKYDAGNSPVVAGVSFGHTSPYFGTNKPVHEVSNSTNFPGQLESGNAETVKFADEDLIVCTSMLF